MNPNALSQSSTSLKPKPENAQDDAGTATTGAVTFSSRYSVLAASRAGSEHDGKEENNQDFFDFRITNENLFLAVCDGLGSCKHSRKGAELVVDLALKFLKHHNWQKPFDSQAREFIAKAQNEIETVAVKSGFAAREMACTLLAFAVCDNQYRTMQLGDGFIVTRFSSDAEYEMLFPCMEKEYANDTMPVTHAKAITSLRTREGFHVPHFICLSSDGLERQAIKQIYTPDEQAHPDFFNFLIDDVLPYGQERLQMYLSLPFWDKHTNDDRTLVCAWLSKLESNVPIKSMHDPAPL